LVLERAIGQMLEAVMGLYIYIYIPI